MYDETEDKLIKVLKKMSDDKLKNLYKKLDPNFFLSIMILEELRFRKYKKENDE